MTKTRAEPAADGIDWSLTTFEGSRREQLRRWAKLPLEEIIQALEEMERLSRDLQSSRGAKPAQPPATDATEAQAFVRAWRERAVFLDRERLAALRALSELDAAQRFVTLQGHSPAPPRPSSGLVEQQRIFARLRQTSR